MHKFRNTLLLISGLAAITATSTLAQSKAPSMEQLLNLSRPGKNHEVLGKLAGNWSFYDTKRTFIKGTLSRNPIYDGRFYQVEITGGKLALPVANGQMKDDNYRSMQLEGYDNPRGEYVMMSVNNHIGSDIQSQTGQFDATKNEFTFEWESMPVPNIRVKNKRVLKIFDTDHYNESYFEWRDGTFVQTRKLAYERIK